MPVFGLCLLPAGQFLVSGYHLSITIATSYCPFQQHVMHLWVLCMMSWKYHVKALYLRCMLGNACESGILSMRER